MSGKKQPILIVFLILGFLVLFLGVTMIFILAFLGPPADFSFGEKIGVILVQGPISDSGPITDQLNKFKKDETIRAIILRIDSPGGGVGPSQEIYREVMKTRKTKKVIASMGGLAASGGYYIAAATDKIVANPGTITGSIGVIMEFVRLEELFKKLGISLEVIKTGEFKDIGSPHRKLSERDRELLQNLLSDVQGQFVRAVAKGRKLSEEKVREIADGRIISGSRAKELGLVDRLGNFRDAVELAKKMSGIKGEVRLVYPEKPSIRLRDLLSESAVKAFQRVIQTRPQARIEYRWRGVPSPPD
jgi:protease-4